MTSLILSLFVSMSGWSQPVPENIFQKYHRGVFTVMNRGSVTRYVLFHQAFVCYKPETDSYCVDKYIHDSQDPQNWPTSLDQFQNVLHAQINANELEYDWIENLEEFCQKSNGNLEPLQTKIGLLTTCKVDTSTEKIQRTSWYAAGIVFSLVKSITKIGYSEQRYEVQEIR